MIEKLGLVAACTVAASFFMNGEKKIRITNTVGSALFVVYGINIGASSIIFLNTVSIVVNLIKLRKKGDADETT